MSAPVLDQPLAPQLDFADFCRFLGDEIGCTLARCETSTLLVEELGWDSLAFFELLGLFDRFELDAPDELVGALRTLGDVHHYFTQLSMATEAPRAQSSDAGPVLQPPTQRDFEYLFQLHATGEHLVRYRLRGVTPSPDAFHRLLWEGITAQFVVRSDQGAAVGLVSCFGADFRNRHAHIGVLGDPDWKNSGVLVAGAWQFIGYLFSEFDLRKLYAEVLQSNFDQLATGTGRLFEVEGRLSSHEYVSGRYEDVLVLALDRDRWRQEHRRMRWREDSEPVEQVLHMDSRE